MPPPLIGQFVDAPVEGLLYETATLSGLTNAQGEFEYQEGEQVRFRVGDIVIGEALGAPTLSPFDLAGATPPQSPLDVRREVQRERLRTEGSGEDLSPLMVAARIALFLQTIDENEDSSDGIVVPPALHTLAVGLTLEFDGKDLPSLGMDFTFRKLLAAGRAAGLWGGARAIRSNWYALDALYAGTGIAASIDAYDSEAIDHDGDGIPESRYWYEFDAHGNLSKCLADHDADGVVDSCRSYSYDTHGHLTTEDYDGDLDGTSDGGWIYTFDANGNQTLDEYDSGGDGKADYRHRRGFDVYGNQVTEELDQDADGRLEYRYSITYDSNGKWILEEYDDGADGTVDGTRAVTRDAAGNALLYEEQDENGVPFLRIAGAFDAMGNKVMEELDYPVDGVIERREIYAYDADDHRVLYERDGDYGPDDAEKADGIADYRIIYTYDANGKLIAREDDDDADGVVDSRITYEYDSNGYQTVLEIDDDADGIADSRDRYTYDADQNLILYEGERRADGVVTERTTYTRDANGNRTLLQYDEDADGVFEYTEAHSYRAVDRWSSVDHQEPYWR